MASSSTTSKLQGCQFAELNLRHTGNPRITADLVSRAIRMGYDAVAINIDVGDPFTDRVQETLETEPVPKKKRKMLKKAQQETELDIFPTPFKVPIEALPAADIKRIESDGKVFRQFSRVTLTVTDSTSVYKMMTHPKIKLFDIVAIRITDPETLNTLSRKGDVVDIVTFDSCDSQKHSWMFQPKLIQAVAAEGIGFELTYGQALSDSSSRRQFLSNGRQLIEVTRQGRNVFFSSGATDILQIRSPYDAANLSCLLGLDSYKGIHLISSTPKNILLRSQARSMTIKGAINIANLTHVPHRTLDPDKALEALMKVEEFQKQSNVTNSNEPVKEIEMETN